MLVGHFAVGFAAKCREPRVSLGTFVLAAMLADLLLVLFWLGGIDRVEIVRGSPGPTGSTPADVAFQARPEPPCPVPD